MLTGVDQDPRYKVRLSSSSSRFFLLVPTEEFQAQDVRGATGSGLTTGPSGAIMPVIQQSYTGTQRVVPLIGVYRS